MEIKGLGPILTALHTDFCKSKQSDSSQRDSICSAKEDPYAMDVSIKFSASAPKQVGTDTGCTQTDSGCYGTQSGCTQTSSGCYGTQNNC